MKRTSKLLSILVAGAALLVLPGLASAQSLSHIEISPNSISGGKTASGQVFLNGKAPTGGLVITLSSDQTFATVPTSVTVAAGSKNATFSITTSSVATVSTATITGVDPNNKKETSKIKVYPAYLKALSLSPQSVTGGASSTATLTLSGNAPTGGLLVNLLVNETYVQVPASVTVPAGANTATFTVTTSQVTKNGSSIIVATDAYGYFA